MMWKNAEENNLLQNKAIFRLFYFVLKVWLYSEQVYRFVDVREKIRMVRTLKKEFQLLS